MLCNYLNTHLCAPENHITKYQDTLACQAKKKCKKLSACICYSVFLLREAKVPAYASR